jgi:hypothetical protein
VLCKLLLDCRKHGRTRSIGGGDSLQLAARHPCCVACVRLVFRCTYSSVLTPSPTLLLLSQVVAEHDRHARAASGLVQGVEEGLAQITAAGEEAGLAAAAGLQVEGAGQCMDMEEDRAGQVRRRGRHFTCESLACSWLAWPAASSG